MKDELREAARITAEQKQRDNDIGSFIPCEWSHLGIFRNGFDAGYDAGKRAERERIANLIDQIQLRLFGVDSYWKGVLDLMNELRAEPYQ